MQTDMQRELKREVKKYLNEIRYLLPGGIHSKNKYITGLKEQIYDFIDERENTSFRDILLHFGEKETIVQQYIKDIDVNAVKQKLSVLRATAVVLFAAILIWGAAMCFIAADAHFASHGYYFENTDTTEVYYE